MDINSSSATGTKVALIKMLYLYVVSFVALMMLVISSVDIISLFLKTYILTRADRYAYAPVANCDVSKQTPSVPVAADSAVVPVPKSSMLPTISPEECRKQAEEQKRIDEENRQSQRQSDLVRDISLLAVATPLFIGHWRLARKKE